MRWEFAKRKADADVVRFVLLFVAMRAALFKPKARLMVKVVVAVALAAFNLNQRHSFFLISISIFFSGDVFIAFRYVLVVF